MYEGRNGAREVADEPWDGVGVEEPEELRLRGTLDDSSLLLSGGLSAFGSSTDFGCRLVGEISSCAPSVPFDC